jgi:hypothetical protein
MKWSSLPYAAACFCGERAASLRHDSVSEVLLQRMPERIVSILSSLLNTARPINKRCRTGTFRKDTTMTTVVNTIEPIGFELDDLELSVVPGVCTPAVIDGGAAVAIALGLIIFVVANS